MSKKSGWSKMSAEKSDIVKFARVQVRLLRRSWLSDNVLPDFTGRVVVIYVSNGADSGLTLEYPEFKTFNDRLFLVGRTPQIAESWSRNLSAGAAWDSVTHYFIF